MNSATPTIKIICTFHNSLPIENDISDKSRYVPIIGGYSIGNRNPNIETNDSTGENISYLNREINEITVLYWVWKHYDEIGNPSFIGHNHYRRFLHWTYDDLKNDVILAHENDLLGRNVIDQYRYCHLINDFLKFNIHLKEILNDDERKTYENFLVEPWFYGCNMFIMSKDNFFEYMEFMNKCIGIVKEMLDKHEVNLNDGRDSSQRRAFSFILERITGFWIRKKEILDGLKIKHVERTNVGCL